MGDTPPAEIGWFMTRVFGRKRPALQVIRFPLTEAVVDATRAGMGVAILSEWIAGPYVESGGLVAKRFSTEPLRRPWRITFAPQVAEVAHRLAGAIQGTAPRGHPTNSAPPARLRLESSRAGRP